MECNGGGWQVAVSVRNRRNVGRNSMRRIAPIIMLGCCAWARGAEQTTTPPSDPFEVADHIFADFCLDAHIPGLVYGVVADSRLVHVGTFGVQDLESRRPVTADTLFRI